MALATNLAHALAASLSPPASIIASRRSLHCGRRPPASLDPTQRRLHGIEHQERGGVPRLVVLDRLQHGKIRPAPSWRWSTRLEHGPHASANLAQLLGAAADDVAAHHRRGSLPQEAGLHRLPERRHPVALDLEVDRYRGAAQLGMGRRRSIGIAQALCPRDVGGELQDALVVDLAQLRHAIARSPMPPGEPEFLARTMLTYYIPAYYRDMVAPPSARGARTADGVGNGGFQHPHADATPRREKIVQSFRTPSHPRAEPAPAMNDIATRKGAVPLKSPGRRRPTQAEAEEAVRTLIAWAGDDPAREGLRETPRRVTGAYEEYYSGYRQDPAEVLAKTFDEAGGYDDLVMLRDIRVESHCEHHMTPFLGVAHVAYLPKGRIVGISKIARV